MKFPLTVLGILLPSLAWAAEKSLPPAPKNKISAIALLPDGSELKGVLLPRYDENRKLVGSLKAATMTLVRAGQIAGSQISIQFYNPDQTSRGRIDLKKALFNDNAGILSADEPVEIKTDRIHASGSGLYYSFERGEGFLLGPATTTLQASPETTMKSSNPSIRATAALGMSLIAAPLSAAPPPPMTGEENAALEKDAGSMAPAANQANLKTEENLVKDVADSDAAGQAATQFLAQADLAPISADEHVPATEPHQIEIGPNSTVIESTGGMYFDADEGVLVYMKNVTVKDPRFSLSGANELKVFFGKKAEKDTEKADSAGEKPKAGFGGKIGDVERIVATGAVKITQNAGKGKEPLVASGALFSYNVKEDQIILKGGFAWFTQGATYMRAKEPNLALRISPKTGSFVTEGNWEMGGDLQPQKKDPR